MKYRRTASPIFSAFDNQDPRITISGVANLPRNLTINSITVAPTFWYKGQDANAVDTKWYPEIGGSDGILTEAGAGTALAYGASTPLLGSDQAVDFNAGIRMEAGVNTFGDVTTEDMVLEAVFRLNGTNGCIFAKRTVVGARGWVFASDTTGIIRVYIFDATGSVMVTAGTVALNGWYHAIFFLDRSGSGRGYLNAIAGSSIVISTRALTLSSLAVPVTFSGYNDSVAAKTDIHMAQAALWKRSDWFPSDAAGLDAQLVIAKQRFRALTGFKPQISNAGVDTDPLSFTRATAATLQKYNTTTSKNEYYTVGSGWLRNERWSSGGSVISGYRSELASTNKITYSHVSEATWTKADAGDTTTAVDGPWGTASAEGWVADATDGDHGRQIATANLTAAQTVFWARVKVGAVGWVGLSNETTGKGKYFNLTTGAVGSNLGAAPTNAYTVNTGDGWWICCIEFLGTVAAHTLKIFPCPADADTTFAGDGINPSILFAHAQCEVGTIDTSPIRTSGAAATRNKDELRYSTSHAGTRGAVIMDVVGRSQTAIPANSYLIDMNDTGSTNRTVILVASTGVRVYHGVSTDGIVQGTAGQALDGTVRRIGHRWQSGVMEAWVGGAYVGQDVAFTLPAAMTQIGIGMATGASNYQPSSPTLIRRVMVYNKYLTDMAKKTKL